MKKLLLLLLCVPLIFSCGEKENNTEDSLSKVITQEMILDNYTGIGTMTYFNGTKYVGEWKDGKRHGYGTFTLPDGGKYVGEFKYDQLDGQGSYTFSFGGVKEGLWKNSVFIGE